MPPGAPLSLRVRIVLLNPARLRVPPVFTKKSEFGLNAVVEPACRMPLSMIVSPEYVLMPERICVPGPDLCSASGPLSIMLPAKFAPPPLVMVSVAPTPPVSLTIDPATPVSEKMLLLKVARSKVVPAAVRLYAEAPLKAVVEPATSAPLLIVVAPA